MKTKSFPLITTTLLCSALLSHTASAFESDYYYDGMKPHNLKTGYAIAKQYSNELLISRPFGNNPKSPYKAVGYVQNTDGWAGTGVEVMGTGFVIDDYTVLTNAHVIDNKEGKKAKSKFIKFMMNRDGDDIPYEFEVKDIVKIPKSDVAVIHTKKKLTMHVKPLKLATDYQTKKLKKGQNLYSVSYPYHDSDDYTTRFYTKAIFLQHSSNETELMIKDKFRAGASGAPLVDAKYRVHGVRTYSHKLYNVDDDQYGKVELSGAESLYGYTGNQVLKYSY